MTIEAIIEILKNIEPFTNIAVVIIALVAIIQTTISIRQTKRDSVIHLILTMYTECRKVIDSSRIEDCSKNPVGLDCFKVAYIEIFRAELTKCKDSSSLLVPDKDVIPTAQQVEQKFQKIVNNTCPNIGTYLSSVVSILALIDGNKSLDEESKKQCASYIKAQTTKYEKIWLYYYYLLKKKDSELLFEYLNIEDVSKSDVFKME